MAKVFFLPSDLYTKVDPKDGSKPRFEKGPDGKGGFAYRYWSTGRLERAIRENCLYYILVEERSMHLDFSQWWLKMANPQSILKVLTLESQDSPHAIDVLLEFHKKHAAGTAMQIDKRPITWSYIVHSLCQDLGFIRGGTY